MNKTNIAVVFDWDKTLSPYYMQTPLFKKFGVDQSFFWDLANKRANSNSEFTGTKCFCEHEYLNLILENSVKGGMFPGLTNKELTKLGKKIELSSGVLELFGRLNCLGVSIFIVTSGMRSMLLDHAATRYVPHENIHGAEFADWIWHRNEEGELIRISQPRLTSVIKSLCPSDKIRVLMEINKGCTISSHEAHTPIKEEFLAFPYRNMIYVGDGVSDIYAFEAVKKNGGSTVGVYNPDAKNSFSQLEMIRKNGFLDVLGIADFSLNSTVGNWIKNKVMSLQKLEMNKEKNNFTINNSY